jgi:predicted NUDIX family NTP pyrophosphohydrolase
MPVPTAGLLMCRKTNGELEFLLVHPGGPFFAKKNEGAWSIPKGIADPNEKLEDAAEREFFEETGIKTHPPYYPLGSIKMKSGKIIHIWLFFGDWDERTQPLVSNTFDLEWPPKSGKFTATPEVDRAEWMNFEKAKKMINPNQIPFLERAIELHEKD